MARYQKHMRFATSQGKLGAPKNATARPLVFNFKMSDVRGLWALWAAALALLAALGPVEPLRAAALPQTEQSAPGITRQLYLLPAESTTVQLQTHVANFSVVDAGEGAVSVYADAAYTLNNTGREPATLPLLLFLGTGSVEPQDVSLMVESQVVGLTPHESGYAAQIEIGADTRLTLQLRYRLLLDDAPLATVRYAPSILRRWPGGISLRVEVSLPNSIPRESWTTVAPDTWTYATTGADVTAVRWLYDAGMPQEPFAVQFVNPAIFAQVQAAEAATAANGPAAGFLALGDLYRTLSEADAAAEPVRERFAAQAIAAYADGVARHSSAAGDELARLHIGLAGIYRSRSVTASEGMEQYAAAMAEEAGLALALLPAEDSRRSELLQWRADGLQLALARAMTAGEWSRADTLLDELMTLPPEIVDPAMLAQQRQALLVQQALQLLARGEREAAITLAGPEIVGEVAMPPPELQPLFARWQITTTAEADGVQIDALGFVQPGRMEEARQTLTLAASRWQSAGAEAEPPEAADDQIRLRLKLPHNVDGALLATHLPASADWTLLAAAVAQAEPKVETSTRLFWRDVRISRPLDLHTAGDQWNALAANLEHQAATLATEADSGAQSDAEAALRRQIQAVNYRNTAESWRSLARDSWLLYRFETAPGDGTLVDGERVWYATVKSPPLVFSVQTQTVNTNLLAGFGVLMAVFVTGVSGLLWRLM